MYLRRYVYYQDGCSQSSRVARLGQISPTQSVNSSCSWVAARSCQIGRGNLFSQPVFQSGISLWVGEICPNLATLLGTGLNQGCQIGPGFSNPQNGFPTPLLRPSWQPSLQQDCKLQPGGGRRKSVPIWQPHPNQHGVTRCGRGQPLPAPSLPPSLPHPSSAAT